MEADVLTRRDATESAAAASAAPPALIGRQRALAGLLVLVSSVALVSPQYGVGTWWSVAVLVGGGLVAGTLAGALGIGGALITVPVLWFALPHLGIVGSSLSHTVVASSLVAMLPTGIAAAWAHHRLGHIDAAYLKWMAPWMLLGAAGGALLAADLHGAVLALSFAAQAICYGARLLVLGAVEPGRRPPGLVARAVALLPTPLAGASTGAFCACVGMGGGSLVVPYLTTHGLSFRSAVATGGALNLCIAAGGSVAFATAAVWAGVSTRPAWVPAIVLGSLAAWAAPLGVAVAARLPATRLGFAVGLVNISGALALLAQAL